MPDYPSEVHEQRVVRTTVHTTPVVRQPPQRPVGHRESERKARNQITRARYCSHTGSMSVTVANSRQCRPFGATGARFSDQPSSDSKPVGLTTAARSAAGHAVVPGVGAAAAAGTTWSIVVARDPHRRTDWRRGASAPPASSGSGHGRGTRTKWRSRITDGTGTTSCSECASGVILVLVDGPGTACDGEHDGPPSRHDGERLVGGVEQQYALPLPGETDHATQTTTVVGAAHANSRVSSQVRGDSTCPVHLRHDGVNAARTPRCRARCGQWERAQFLRRGGWPCDVRGHHRAVLCRSRARRSLAPDVPRGGPRPGCPPPECSWSSTGAGRTPTPTNAAIHGCACDTRRTTSAPSRRDAWLRCMTTAIAEIGPMCSTTSTARRCWTT